jgi:hypothetical protein
VTIPRRRVLAGLAGVAGCAALSPAADARRPKDPKDPGEAAKLTRYGITWAFSRPRACGRYVTGDWWVIGPVEIIGISPRSDRGDRVVNGTMINPKAGPQKQGYDSAMYGDKLAAERYVDELNAALGVSPERPLTVRPGSSLVSTISKPQAGARPQLQAAAVLTVVDQPPPADAFRPPYCGADKLARWTTASLHRDQLRAVKSAAGAPSLSEMEAAFERPWIDHVTGWLSRYIHPSENMPDYGREMAIRIGEAGLLLNTDIPLKHKERLLQRFVQLGIDLHGVVQDGGEWPPDGGHGSGRKLPILFAGLLLNNEDMLSVGERKTMFGEDAQTFYVARTPDGRINSGFGEYSPQQVGLPEWGIRHATIPKMDNAAWDAKYRTCCTANAWVAMVLTAHIMGLKKRWNHDTLFDYQDRYMAHPEDKAWERSMTDWPARMWDMHRKNYPPVWRG